LLLGHNSATTLSIRAHSITTLSMEGLLVTLSIYDTQHYETVIMLSAVLFIVVLDVIMLTVVMLSVVAPEHLSSIRWQDFS